MSEAPLPVANSYAVLAPSNATVRVARVGERQRSEAFAAAFDAKTLFYDCFQHQDGRRILLVGPPPYGIDYRNAIFSVAGATLQARYYPSLSTMVTELVGAPADAPVVRVDIAGETYELLVRPNSSAALAGRRLLFTINRDNELRWIREWAEYHQRTHGTDAVVLFDNGSSKYDLAELHATLAGVSGIADVAVPSWPYSFGPFDPAVIANPHWARFLQIGSMSVALRRYGEQAFGLLNCDIDELAGTISGRSIFDLTHVSRGGLVVFRGTWIETEGEGVRHREFTRRLADPKAAISPQRKWCLDPSRAWVRRLSVHPYWHWIEGRAWFSKTMPDDATYWHFRGINTNWKETRTAAPAGPTVEDTGLATAMRRAGFVA